MVEGLRVAIVGCGRMGGIRARACRALGARVALLHDVDAVSAQELALVHRSARIVGSLTLLDWESVDAAFICTPPHVRSEPIVDAVRAGVPVLVEKPVGTDAGSVASICDELERSPTLVAVGYMNRYRESVQRLLAELEGETVAGLNGVWIAPPYDKPWWGVANGAGALHDYATHFVDLYRVLAGEITEVSAVELDGARTGAAFLELASGASATLVYSSLGSRKEIGLEVVHPDGSADRLLGWGLRREGFPDEPVGDVFDRETRLFLEAVRDPARAGPICIFAEALKTQEVVDAISRAGQTGRRQRLGLVSAA